ncbi:MAG TPA: MurT ligase domain-containing protein [Baekduia sp.]|nr:MurT ligase domain-containing protein [Baekduia sp.]
MLGPKLLTARLVARLTRLSGRGAGTSLPGKVLMRLEPSAIEQLSSRLDRGSAVISATNGKTTTAAMVASILEQGGSKLVHNSAGANMSGGIATTLLDAAHGSRMSGDTGLFEVDEFWLADVVRQVHPKALLLANLFRDQLDRYGELEAIADRWKELASGLRSTRLILNADDPMVAGLGADEARTGIVHFGVEDTSMALAGMQHASDAKHCRVCGHLYRYDAVFLGHLGHYHCDNCGATRPVPQVAATSVVLDGVRGARVTISTPTGEIDVSLPLPGLYNVYNALGAVALATAMGATLKESAAGLRAVRPAFGRAETIKVEGRELLLLLIKNPAGANEVLRTLVLEDGQHDLFCVLNDKIADGRDISWIWDADFEHLAPRVRRAVCSGTRAAEMGLRLKYAGIPEQSIVVIDSLPEALDAAVAGSEQRVMALPTYTAMLELRELLASRGLVRGQFT